MLSDAQRRIIPAASPGTDEAANATLRTNRILLQGSVPSVPVSITLLLSQTTLPEIVRSEEP